METTETTKKTVEKADEICRGVGGESDTLDLIRHLPGIRPTIGTQYFLEAVALLHTARGTQLYDKQKKHGVQEKVSAEDLRHEGIPEHVVYAVEVLAGEPWMTRHFYYRGLDQSFELIKIVKVCAQIALLRRLRTDATTSAWIGQTYEAKGFVLPLTFEMSEPWRSWLVQRLDEAASGEGSKY